MKCPKCHRENLKYLEKRAEKIRTPGINTIQPRTNFKARCKKCGWEGEI